jgi:SAM-dependent methyltransferase
VVSSTNSSSRHPRSTVTDERFGIKAPSLALWPHGHNDRVPSPEAASVPENDPHRQRQAAESFGSDPERYDRARPRYPDVMIERIAAAAPGRLVLDVGVATGIVARQFQAAGCQVLGVDPDARLAEFARHSGVEVEVSTFEAWEAAGRRFDAVVSGESWHWVDPVGGAAKAAEVLRPGGRLAVFWITGQPAEGLDEAFVEVYRRVLPESLVARLGKRSLEEAHSAMCAKAADGMRATGALDEPERWRFEWAQSYTRDEWLDALQTSGGAVPESQLADLLEGVGDAIDAVGGSFTMNYFTFVVTAVRQS